MRRKRAVLTACGVVALWAGAARSAEAQDPVTVAPENYKVVFENERVRLLEFRDKPGDKIAVHSHPENLVYLLTDGKRRMLNEDGAAEEVEMQAGAALWFPAEKHGGENIGTTETHVLIFELKEPSAAPAEMSETASRQAQ